MLKNYTSTVPVSRSVQHIEDRLVRFGAKSIMKEYDGQKVLESQAERTAWKLVSDWVDIQLSLVELGQVELLEVLLPYVYDVARGKTFFEKVEAKMKGGDFKLLEFNP